MRRRALLFVALLGSAAVAAKLPSFKMECPGAVALSRDSRGNWIFKSFPALLPLYVFDGDLPGKSMCDVTCTAVWPLLRATAEDKAVGNWTIILRDDGRRQWAYKNRPVYTFYNDTPGNAKGVGREEGWYYEELPRGGGKKASANAHAEKPIWRLLEPES